MNPEEVEGNGEGQGDNANPDAPQSNPFCQAAKTVIKVNRKALEILKDK